jgi:hypothetical protein
MNTKREKHPRSRRMVRGIQFLGYSTYLCLLCQPAQSATPAQVLVQVSDLVGTQEVTYCPLGLKVKSSKHDYVFLMSPPDWKVILYNPAKRVYFETMPDSWFGPLGQGVQSTWEDRFKQLVIASKSPGNYAGLKAQHIFWKSKVGIQSTASGDTVTQEKTNRLELLSKSAEQWCTKDSPYMKKMSLVLGRFYHLPIVPGIPLSFKYRGFSGSEHDIFHTIRHQTKMCTAADFEPPKGLRKVKKERDVAFVDNTESLLDILK